MKKITALMMSVLIVLSSFSGFSALAVNENQENEGVASLDGKKVYLVGNSMIYYGNCALLGAQGKEDNGYFKQLTRLNGENTSVIDYAYPGRSLKYTYENYLTKISYEERQDVDYVVLSEHTTGSKDLKGDVGKIMALFPQKTKFYFLCHQMAYDNGVNSLIYGMEDLRRMGVEIVSWGKLVYDVYTGITAVPFAKNTYTRATFIKENEGYKNADGHIKDGGDGDNKHPNPLAGYITALYLYTAITHKSAVLQDYDFCSDTSIHNYYSFEGYKNAHYTGPTKTNFDKVFSSFEDMSGLQMLIDRYNEKEGRHSYYIFEKGQRGNCTIAGTSDSYICSVCGNILPARAISPVAKHTFRFVEGEEKICTADGIKAHYECINEGCTFKSSDPYGLNELNAVEEKATGHNLKAVSEIKPTCENDGIVFHYVCINENCKRLFSDKDGLHEIENVIAPKIGHSLKYVKGKSATCEKSGMVSHYECKRNNCEAMFLDKKGKNQVVDVTVEPKGHSIKIEPAVKANCVSEGKTEREICTVCGHIFLESVKTGKTTHKYKDFVEAQATVNNDGKIITKCTGCNLQKSSKTVSKIKTIKLKSKSLTYNGKVKAPTVIVKDADANSLKKGIDYDVKYLTDRKSIGNHKVKIVFKGKYKGSKTLKFKILPSSTKKITVKATGRTLATSWEKVKGATGYKVSLVSKKGETLKTVYTNDRAYNFKKLSRKTYYKIKVRAYKTIDGKKLYSEKSKTVNASTK